MKTRKHAVTVLKGITLAIAVILASAPTLWANSAQVAASPPPSMAAVETAYGHLPLSFEANQGQVDAQVKFLARGSGYTLFLTPTESVMVLQQREAPAEHNPRAMTNPTALPKPAPIHQAVVRMKLEGANSSPAIDGMEQLPGIVNYFIGNDPAKWHTDVPTYAKVQYQDAYPGIALAYYGNQGRLEYDFIVAPGADPNQITLVFEGALAITLADSGDLLLTTALGDVRMQKPVVYQLEPDGHKTLVAGHYVVASTSVSLQASRTTRHSVGFQLASYDHAKPVVIDPVLFYSTYLGGSSDDIGNGIAVDAAGSAYVTGQTTSTNFPTANPVQATIGGASDAFVAKISALKPPVCSAAHANPAALWSPNHQFVPIVVKGVTDPDGNAVTITITGVTQDEPVNGKGDGNTSPDAVIQDGAASVRAERSGTGNGRVYQISFTAEDAKGGSCAGVVRVGVPHSRGKGVTAIDDGQIYDSTLP
jgi:hypothetical protein